MTELTSGHPSIAGAGTFLGAVTSVIKLTVGEAMFPDYETTEVLTETPFFGFADLTHADFVVSGRRYRLRAEELEA